jgi:actin-related protein
MELAGRDVTIQLLSLLRKGGATLTTSAELEVVKSIKEKYCAVAEYSQDRPHEKTKEKKDKYTLPDGQVIELSSNEKGAGEILFCPERVGLETPCNSLLIQQSSTSSRTVSPKSTSTSGALSTAK